MQILQQLVLQKRQKQYVMNALFILFKHCSFPLTGHPSHTGRASWSGRRGQILSSRALVLAVRDHSNFDGYISCLERCWKVFHMMRHDETIYAATSKVVGTHTHSNDLGKTLPGWHGRPAEAAMTFAGWNESQSGDQITDDLISATMRYTSFVILSTKKILELQVSGHEAWHNSMSFFQRVI